MNATHAEVREFSPRMRGCFWMNLINPFNSTVLPAYAGMFLRRSSVALPLMRSPRVCGDVSDRYDS